MFVSMGSTADAVSYEARHYEQGLLTYSLLEGMKGTALREDQYVDINGLFQRAVEEVPELAKGIGDIQKPRIASLGGASFDIGKLLPEDRQAIHPAIAKPFLLQPSFLNPPVAARQSWSECCASKELARGELCLGAREWQPFARSVRGRSRVSRRH